MIPKVERNGHMTDQHADNSPMTAKGTKADRSGPITVLTIFLIGGLVLIGMLFAFQGFAPLEVNWEDYGWTWNPTRDE